MINFDIVNKLSIRELNEILKNPNFNLEDLKFPAYKNIYSFNYLRSAIDFLWKNINLKNKKVVFPAFTCPIVIEIALRNGIEPIIIDCDKDTFNLDFKEIEKLDFSNIDAIFVHHVFGNILDIDKLRLLVKKNVIIVEDAANCIDDNDYIGKGDYLLLSLSKYFPNFRGGLLLSNNIFQDSYELLMRDKIDYKDKLSFLLHIEGLHQYFFNLLRSKRIPEEENMNTLEWEILKCDNLSLKFYLNQRFKAKKEIESRKLLRKYYLENLNPKYFYEQKVDLDHSYMNFSIVLKEDFNKFRDEIYKDLRKKNIFVDRMYFNAPLKEYAKYCHGECKNAFYLASSIINLPIRSSYDEKDIKFLCESVNNCLEILTA